MELVIGLKLSGVTVKLAVVTKNKDNKACFWLMIIDEEWGCEGEFL